MIVLSNRLFQSIIHQMKDVVGRSIGIADDAGAVVASTELGQIGETLPVDISPAITADGPVVIGENTFRAFGTPMQPEFAVFVEGVDSVAEKYATVLAVSLDSIKQKYDRGNFIKNVMLDNILPGDIYLKSRELHFNNDVMRVVFLVRFSQPCEIGVFDMFQQLFPDRSKDFIVNVNETDLAVVKEISVQIESRDLEKLARSVIDALSSVVSGPVLVGIGTQVKGIKDISRSFRDAQVALEVGKVFDTEKVIVSYENLGIARLIYQLPNVLCDMFLKEVFKRGSIETLDHETLFTIQKFFENNLNVSETSRKLFVHRNTLVYRLEKIRKLTGLDLREFDDAIVFKVALMVKKYLDSTPIKF